MNKTEQAQSAPPQIPSVVGRVFRILLKTLLVLILLLALFLLGTNAYLKSNKTKIFSNLSILNDGAISFGAADISVFKDFPAATISLKNISLRDARFEKHGQPILELQTLHLAVSLKELLAGEIEIKSIGLKDGAIIIFSDEQGYSNLKSFFSEKNKEGDGFIKVLTDQAKVTITNVECYYTDAIKTTSIHGKLEVISAELCSKGEDLTAEIDLSIFMEGLTIKEEMGAFAANSRLSGKADVVIKNGNIQIEPFPLSINEEQFIFSGNYDTQKERLSHLVWENEKTRLSQTLPILPPSLQEQIKPYEIAGAFYSKTTVSSFFRPGEKAMVNVAFRLDGNDVVVTDTLAFGNTSLTGLFINNLPDGQPINDKNEKGIRLELLGIRTDYDGFQVRAKRTLFTIVAGCEPLVASDLLVKGRPSSISKWLKSDKFFLKNGTFVLDGNIQGPLLQLKQIIIDSEVHLDIKNFAAIYKPSRSAFPFRKLTLYKKQGDADFTILSSTLNNGHEFRIEGGLKNMPALVLDLLERSSSDVNFVAAKISWTDFLDLFGENGYLDDGTPKDEQEKKLSMKETIRSIQFHFQPRLAVAVDTLQYFDALELHKFRMGVHFENEHIMVLENSSFNYREGTVNFRARLDIRHPQRTPFEFELHAQNLNLAELLPPLDYFKIKLLANMNSLPENISVDIKHRGIMDDLEGLIPHTSTGEIVFKVDRGNTFLGKITYTPTGLHRNENASDLEIGESVKTKISLDGAPSFFNDFFKTEQFFFDKGHFRAQLEYEGDVTDFGEVLHKADGTFSLSNSEVYFKPANVNFPLTNVELDLHSDLASFSAFLKSGTPRLEVTIIGIVQNISELVIGNTGKEIRTTAQVTSPVIEWKQFLDVFTPLGTGTPKEKQLALKSTTKGILSTFRPELSIMLDTFIYSEKFRLHEVQTGISLRDTATLILDKTGFKFYDGSMSLHGTMDLGHLNATPFEGHFQTDNMDVAKLLESLNYLNIPSFQNLEKLSGRTTMDLDLSSAITEDGKGLVPAITNGLLDFELKDIVIKGFAPLDALAGKIFLKKRFNELALAPITNRVTIEGPDIFIPLMEIQSNAINMFIEGTYSYGDNTNIWVTLPLANLKSPDPSTIPPKRGYESVKWKIYLEVVTDQHGENKFKFHYRKKKFYKQRGMPEQFRIDKRKYKKWRKEQKQGG